MSHSLPDGYLNGTEKGYIRYGGSATAMAYEHRIVARIAWGPRVPWPRGAQVHHMDGNRSHNCRQNLVIIAGELHDARTQKGRK